MSEIVVLSDNVQKSALIRLLGAWLDESLNFDQHAMRKSRNAMWNLMKLKQIRDHIDTDTCKILVNSLVTSDLDYCNGILYGSSSYVIKKLQRVQNAATKL